MNRFDTCFSVVCLLTAAALLASTGTDCDSNGAATNERGVLTREVSSSGSNNADWTVIKFDGHLWVKVVEKYSPLATDAVAISMEVIHHPACPCRSGDAVQRDVHNPGVREAEHAPENVP